MELFVQCTEKGCNKEECFQTKLQFGLANGCKEATGPSIKECGSSFTDQDRLKYCVCDGDKCNGENSFGGGNNGGAGGGGDGSDRASSLKEWTAIPTGLMMASLVIATGGLQI